MKEEALADVMIQYFYVYLFCDTQTTRTYTARA